jgi:predicted P-loop ATPase
MNISLFKSGRKSSQPIEQTTIQEFLNNVKFGKWKDLIDTIREEENEDVKSELKKDLIGVTISGTFSNRKAEKLESHSGFICMDFDKIQDLETAIDRVKQDPYTYALAKSASGRGFFVFVKINPKKHEECFNFLASHYYENYGLAVDQAPKSVASLRFASYDPDLYINEKSNKSLNKETPKRKPKKLNVVLTGDEIDQLIINAMHEGANVCESYADWLKVGFALSELGETGRAHFHTLSSAYSEYKQKECDKQFDKCLKATGTGITISTLYWMLKQKGVTLPYNDKEAKSFALVFKAKGSKPEEIKEALVELKGKTKDEADAIVKAIKDHKTIDLSDISDSTAKLNVALKQWVLASNLVKYNEVTKFVEVNQEPLTDRKINTLVYNSQIDFDSSKITPQKMIGMIQSETMPSYNPFKEFYEKNKDMKTNGELYRIADVIKAKDDISKNLYIRKWFLGMIASIHGYPVRYVLSLVGKGRTGKTEFIRRLLPKDLEMYAGESELQRGKDDELLMCQKLIVLIDEFSGEMANDAKKFKLLTSKKSFDLRAPFAKTNEVFRRLAIIAITSNQIDIMNDHTGNTRLLPIEVNDRIDFDLLESIDKTALFVEAWKAFEKDELDRPWELNDEEHDALENHSEEYEVSNIEKALVNKYFRPPTQDEIDREVFTYMTPVDIQLFCEEKAGNRKLLKTRFTHALKNMDKEMNTFCQKRLNGRNPTNYYKIMMVDTLINSRIGIK